MKWEDFKKERSKGRVFHSRYEPTDIECPVCGKLVYRRTDVALASFPPQYGYFCECGWHGTA